MNKRFYVAGILVALCIASVVTAQDVAPVRPVRTDCAITFSRRLAETRAQMDVAIEAGRSSAPSVSAENARCLEDDALHRTALVTRDGAYGALDRNNILCFGDASAICVRSRELAEQIERRQAQSAAENGATPPTPSRQE